MSEIKKTFTVTDENFETFINSDQPVLVDFWAPWCGPCQMLAPIMEELSNDFAGKAKIGKLNVDENMQIASKFGIHGIPTVKIFKNGKEVFSESGAYPKEFWASALTSLS
ncbi:MAG: thioredoxin [Pseudomonadota bacterium]